MHIVNPPMKAREKPVERRRRHARDGRTLATIGALLVLAASARAQEPARGQTEPTVSRREARRLEQTQALAATNAVAALAFMEEERPRDAGPVWDFTLGNLYAQNERLPEARQAYERALAAAPDFRAAALHLGRVHLLSDRPTPAIRLFQTLARDGPPDADVWLWLGHALLMRESCLSAETAYRQALLLRPDEPEALRGLAQCLMRQERYRETQALLAEWLAAEPARKELWSLLANVRLALDNTDGALVALESARRLGLADADMLATLGDLYVNREQFEDALARYEDAFSRDELDADRLLRAARAYALAQRANDAERLLTLLNERREARTVRLDARQRREARRVLADLALLRDDMEEAIRISETLLAESPLDADALITLGDAYRQTGKPEQAALAYERAARIPDHEAQALTRHAQIEIERERYGRAVELLEAAQRFDPQPHIARYLEQVRRLAESR